MSLRPSSSSPRICSGERYCGLPMTEPAIVSSVDCPVTLAMPKSVTLTRPWVSSRTLLGLMSRWTMPWRWANSSASAVSRTMRSTS